MRILLKTLPQEAVEVFRCSIFSVGQEPGGKRDIEGDRELVTHGSVSF